MMCSRRYFGSADNAKNLSWAFRWCWFRRFRSLRECFPGTENTITAVCECAASVFVAVGDDAGVTGRDGNGKAERRGAWATAEGCRYGPFAKESVCGGQIHKSA